MDSERNQRDVHTDNEVYLLPFKFKHLQQLIEMNERNENGFTASELTMQELPKIGYVAFIGKHAIAAGFLRRVEPNYAQFDTFLSNPYFGSQVRNQALVKIVDALFEEAKDLELKGIIAFTKEPSIFQRAKDNGFEVVNQIILVKSLKGL